MPMVTHLKGDGQTQSLFCGDDESYGVYSISEVPFPSHIRTLLPASENHMLEYLELERARRRLRTVIIALAVFVIFATLLSVSLVLSFQQKNGGDTEQVQSQQKISWQGTPLKTVLVPLNSTDNPSFHVEKLPSYIVKSRTKCVKTCWAYSAFSFRASCDDGYCSCNADNYDQLTCLHLKTGPENRSLFHTTDRFYGQRAVVDDCNIRKNVGAKAAAVLKGAQQRVFSCESERTQTETADLHILSIFGNHWSHMTEVKMTGNRSQPIIIALVNYHPITWKIHMRLGVQIQKVILVSYNHLKRTSVVFDGSTDGVIPEVQRLYSQTGYGEDRYGGHTPELIKNIQEQFGKIRSFTGTSHADEWYLDLNTNSGT